MIERTIFREEHEIFRQTVRRFVDREIVPFHAKWEEEGIVPRELWLKAGAAGLLCCTVPEEYGGMSLILVETDRPGFRHGRNLDKLGHLSSDTSELFFDDVRVPATNLLGAEGGAMAALMSELPQERLTIALHSIASAQRAFDITKAYVQERKAFGQPIGSFQNTRFRLADLKSDLAVGWAYVDQCLSQHVRGELTTYAASTAKLWVTEMHGRLVDQCLQFFGGYGFMQFLLHFRRVGIKPTGHDTTGSNRIDAHT